MKQSRLLPAVVAAALLSTPGLARAVAYYDWTVFTTQYTWLASDVDVCNEAPGGSSCSGYAEVGADTAVDRSTSGAASYETSGRASLATGEVGISGAGDFPYDVSLSNAGFSDAINLSFAGASTTVSMRLTFDGSFADGSYVGAIFTAVPGSAFHNRRVADLYWTGTFDGGPSTPVSSTTYGLSSAPVFSTSGSTLGWTVTDQRVFEADIVVLASDPVLAFRYTLYGGGAFDLASTGTLELELEPGTTWTSDSGVFGPVTAPEPGAAALLTSVAVGVASLRRRRCASHIA